MSYILGALKKAERDRQRGGIPDIDQLISSAPVIPAHPRRRLWPQLLALIAILLTLLLLWQLIPTQQQAADRLPPAGETDKAAHGEQQASGLAVADVSSEALARMPQRELASQEPAQSSPSASQPAASGLPANEPPNLDNIRIEGVMLFDADPAKSRVFVDGEGLRQGDEIRPGVIIRQIGEHHLQLEFGSQSYQLAF